MEIFLKNPKIYNTQIFDKIDFIFSPQLKNQLPEFFNECLYRTFAIGGIIFLKIST